MASHTPTATVWSLLNLKVLHYTTTKMALANILALNKLSNNGYPEVVKAINLEENVNHKISNVKIVDTKYGQKIVEELINGLYQNTWTFSYNKMKTYKYDINISNVGYFLFNLFIDEKGDLEVNIASLKTIKGPKMYYVIILSHELNGLVSRVFKGIVSSVEIMQTQHSNRNLIKSKYLLNLPHEEKNLFKCTLNLYRPAIE
uniref:Uncharacterized protein n=1 Tax=Trichogramma kaykai TaxID=54128 RepID=A0ABD2W7T9_9HYME